MGAPKQNVFNPLTHLPDITSQMKDVTIPLQTCLKMLEMPRTSIVKVLIDKITISLGLGEDMEDEDEDTQDSEGHLDPPEA